MQRKNKTMNQWANMNHALLIYKMITMAVMGFCLLLVALCFYLNDKTPLVIKEGCGDFIYFMGSRKEIALTEKNLQRFISNYVNLRYKWNELNPIVIANSISPMVTDGFKKKTQKELEGMRNKGFKDKKLVQSISNIEVRVTKTRTVAIFDRILRVNGIPLLIPTQISFFLVKGEKSFWNQMGLFVDGITIHEDH